MFAAFLGKWEGTWLLEREEVVWEVCGGRRSWGRVSWESQAGVTRAPEQDCRTPLRTHWTHTALNLKPKWEWGSQGALTISNHGFELVGWEKHKRRGSTVKVAAPVDCRSQWGGSGELEEVNWNDRGWMTELRAYGQRAQMSLLFSYFCQGIFSVRHISLFFATEKINMF